MLGDKNHAPQVLPDTDPDVADVVMSQRPNPAGIHGDDNVAREEVSHNFTHEPHGLHSGEADGSDTDYEDYVSAKADDDGNDDDNDDTFAIEEDIFSMIFVAPLTSLTFWYAMFIFCVQMAILILAFYNILVDPDPDLNKLKIPPYTELEVNFAQFIAVMISVMVSSDVIASLDVLLVRYDPEICQTFEGATFAKWIISHCFRFIEGVVGIIVAFVFIVQSTDVLALFLDFSVVQFVSELDNVGFYLANKGYLPVKDIKDTTDDICNARMRQYRRGDESDAMKKARGCRRGIQVGVFYSMVVILYGSWSTVKILQHRGVFFQMECQRIHVILPSGLGYDSFFKRCAGGIIGDDCDVDKHWKDRTSQKLKYANFNGLYIAQVTETGALKRMDHRPVYTQTIAGDNNFGDAVQNPPGMIRYCKKEEAWIFTIPGVSKGANADDCSWLVKSPETDVLSLNDVPEGDWEVWTGKIEEAAVDLTCAECTGRDLAEEQIGDFGCNFHGTCPYENRTCECAKGYVGSQCSACIHCQRVELLSDDPTLVWPGKFTRLDDEYGTTFEFLERPVFYHSNLDGDAINPLIVFFYWADRYVFWDFSDRIIFDPDLEQRYQLAKYFETFHPLWGHEGDKNDPFYISDKTLVRNTIRGLRWKRYDQYVTNPDFNEDFFRLDYLCISFDHGRPC